MKTVKTMKKALAVFLSAMIVIACCITAIATTPTYTTATDFYTVANWVGPKEGENAGADGSTYIEMGYLRLAERSFAMTLKENTTYTLSFKVTATWGLNGAGKLYIGETLKVYQTDDTTQTDIVTSKTGHDAWLAVGGSSVVTMQFTTGTATGYTLYFKGNWQEDNAALGGKFTNFALTEQAPATPTYTTATDFYTVANWVGPKEGENASADGSTYIEMNYLPWATRTFAMTLKPSTTYQLSYTVTGGWGNDGSQYLNFYEIKAYHTADTAKTDIATNKVGTSGTKVKYNESKDISMEFTTDTTGKATFHMSFLASDAASMGGKFTNFTLTEKQSEPVTPSYTTATDFYTVANWVGPKEGENAGADGSTYIEMNYLPWATRTFAMTLKPSTTYQLSYTVTGGWGNDGSQYLNFYEIKAYHTADTAKTDIATNKIGTSGTKVKYNESKDISMEFTTDTTGKATFHMSFLDSDAASMGGKFTNFALTEKESNPYTTATDFYTVANWDDPKEGENAGADGSTYIEMNYLSWQTRSFDMTLKPNTSYKLSYTVTGGWGDTGQHYLSFSTIKVYNTADTEKQDIAKNKVNIDASVKYNETANISMEFTTDDTGNATLCMICPGLTPQKLGGKFTNFVLEEFQPTAWEEFSAPTWTVYAHGASFGSEPASGHTVTTSSAKDVNGDGTSLAVSANSAVATTPFAVEKNKTYTLTYKYYADSALSWNGYNLIMTDTFISTGSADVVFKDGHVAGNLSGIGLSANFTTTGGDPDTVVSSTTGQKTSMAADVIKGRWHTVALQFNSADYETLYLGIRMGWGTPLMYLDDIQLIEGTPDLDGDFKSTNWTVYEQGDTAPGNTFNGKIKENAGVKSSLVMDTDGDGISLEVNASNNVPTVPFKVAKKNTDYTLSFKYYANNGVTNFINSNFIIKEAFVSNGTTVFDFGSVSGNLAYSGFNQSFTTTNGDADTKVGSFTENLTALGNDMKNNWHTVKLRFNSGDYTDLYLGMCLGWGVDTMYIDNITLTEYQDPAKAESWTPYDGDAADLNAAPSTTLTVGDTTAAEHVKYGTSSIELNTAGGHAAVPIEVEPNTAYYLYYYYKSDAANAVAASTVLAPGAAFTSPLGTADLGGGQAGKWSKALIEFNSGDNTVVYLNVDVKDRAAPVYFNGLKVLPDVDANTAMESAEQWIAYGGEGINGVLADSWAVISDSYNPNYDHDGDGHAVKLDTPNCYSTVPLRHLQTDTWYRLTYWYYCDQQVNNYAGRDFILDNTRVSKEDAKFDFGAAEGALVGQNFTTNFTTQNGNITTAISYIGGGTGELAGTKQYAGNWHRVEMFFNSYDNETLYLSLKPAALGGTLIRGLYVDDCKLELAQPHLLTGEEETDILYTEQAYNGLPNASFESATTDNDWGKTLPTGMTIKSGKDLPHGTKYLNVNGRHVYELRLKGMSVYTLAASLRGTGLVGITSDHEGLNYLLNEEGTAESILMVDGATDWQRKAFTFRASASGLLYLVFDAETSLDVDYIQLFEKEFGRTADLDNFIPIEDFDFDNIDPSIIVLNGGVDEDYEPPLDADGDGIPDTLDDSPGTGESAVALILAVTLLLSAVAALFVSKQKKGGEV